MLRCYVIWFRQVIPPGLSKRPLSANVQKLKGPSSLSVDDGPWLICRIARSSAAFLRCKHQARNGHAKGEYKHSHLLCSTAHDDCQSIHFRLNLAYYSIQAHVETSILLLMQIAAVSYHFFR
jgi:hypothetical protein